MPSSEGIHYPVTKVHSDDENIRSITPAHLMIGQSSVWVDLKCADDIHYVNHLEENCLGS